MGMRRTFIETNVFRRSWKAAGLGDDELAELEELLLTDPQAGDVIPGLEGARKVRVPLEGRGKSGGARVVYVDVVIREQIYLLLAYPKNVRTNLTPEQEKLLRSLIKRLMEE